MDVAILGDRNMINKVADMIPKYEDHIIKI
jgi:hypothetical protein